MQKASMLLCYLFSQKIKQIKTAPSSSTFPGSFMDTSSFSQMLVPNIAGCDDCRYPTSWLHVFKILQTGIATTVFTFLDHGFYIFLICNKSSVQPDDHNQQVHLSKLLSKLLSELLSKLLLDFVSEFLSELNLFREGPINLIVIKI